MKKFYAYVVSPKKMGVTDEWRECEEIVKGRPGARYKRFSTVQDAQRWLRDGAPYDQKSGSGRTLGKGIYFDSGTGRGMGLVEVNVANERGEGLLSLIISSRRLTKFGTFVITRRSATNNFGELLALSYALKIALQEGTKKIFGDSRLVIQYWSKGQIRPRVFSKSVYTLVSEVSRLRAQFEDMGGEIEYIAGSRNPADLGFHR